jgi:hypothetical protein
VQVHRVSIDGQQKLQEEFARMQIQREIVEEEGENEVNGAIDWGEVLISRTSGGCSKTTWLEDFWGAVISGTSPPAHRFMPLSELEQIIRNMRLRTQSVWHEQLRQGLWSSLCLTYFQLRTTRLRIPDTLRGMMWQLMFVFRVVEYGGVRFLRHSFNRAASKDVDLESTYLKLLKETSPHEKAILRDLGRFALVLVIGVKVPFSLPKWAPYIGHSRTMISSQTDKGLARRTYSMC